MAFGIALRAADGLLYPAIDLDTFTMAEIEYFKSLILYCLFVTAYAYVAIIQDSDFLSDKKLEPDESQPIAPSAKVV